MKKTGRPSKQDIYLYDFWFGKPDKHEAAAAMVETAKAVLQMNGPRIKQMEEYTAMYRDKDACGFMPGDISMSGAWRERDRLTYNALKSCADTALAKLTLHEPTADISTFGADLALQEKAQGLEKACTGALQTQGGFETARKVMKDAMICPIGVIKTYDDHDGRTEVVRYKRKHPSKVLWDIEATVDDRRPGTFYEFDERSRASLLSQFCKDKNNIKDRDAILEAPHVTAKNASSVGKKMRDLVEVFESYREGTPDNPGRHIIAIKSSGEGSPGGYALLDEPWTEQAPYSFTRWCDDAVGFDGLPIAHEIFGMQDELTFVTEHIRDNHECNSQGVYFKPKSAEVDDEMLQTNVPHRVVEYVGEKPTLEHPPITHPQVFQYREQLKNDTFEVVGLSQLSATSKKPADLESGAALRTYLDVETVRFAVPQRSWEMLFVDLFKQTIRCFRRIAKRNPKWWVTYVGDDRSLQRIDVAKNLLEDHQMQVRVYPISALPQQPSARLSQVAEMARDQLITPTEFKVLAKMPDLEKFTKLDTAPFDDLSRIMEAMLNPELVKSPDDYERLKLRPIEAMDLQVGVKLATSYRARAAVDGVDGWRLDLLETWIVDAQELEQSKLQQQLALQQLQLQVAQAQQQLQQLQMGGPAGPGGAPEQPPGGPGAAPAPGQQA